MYTWGSSSEGQTGQGSEDCVVPTKVHLRGKVVAVACGYYHMAVATGESQLILSCQLGYTIHPVDSDLFIGRHYLLFVQPGPGF